MTRILNYKEGDIFVVPLKGGGFSLGLVARMAKRGKIILGYFFREKFSRVPKPSDIPELFAKDAVKIGMFGDLSLIKGEWPIIGRAQNWSRDQWPMPKFIRRDPFGKYACLVSYCDDDPSKPISEESVHPETSGYERDSLMGAGYVEIILTRLLENQPLIAY